MNIVRNNSLVNNHSNFCIFSDWIDSTTVNATGDVAITSYLLLYYQINDVNVSTIATDSATVNMMGTLL